MNNELCELLEIKRLSDRYSREYPFLFNEVNFSKLVNIVFKHLSFDTKEFSKDICFEYNFIFWLTKELKDFKNTTEEGKNYSLYEIIKKAREASWRPF